MITVKYRFTAPQEASIALAGYRKQYTAAIFKIYNNIELKSDPAFLDALKDKNPLLSAKMLEHARRQAEGMMKKWEDDQKKLLEEIKELEGNILSGTTEGKKIKGARKITRRDLQKIKNKLLRKKARVGKHPVFGGRALLSRYNKAVAKKDLSAQELLQEYRERRDLGYRSEGEVARTGNRNFSLAKISEGILTFSPEKGQKIYLQLAVSKPRARSKQHKQFLKACDMAHGGKLPITITIKKEEVLFTYDNAAVGGYTFDTKGFNAAKKEAFDIPSYKAVAKEFYRKQEERMGAGKRENRVLSLDLNPERIGYVVLELDIGKGLPVVVAAGCFEYKGLTKKYKDLHKRADVKEHSRATNERNYWLSVIVARIGRLATHYKCAQLAMEGLDIKRPVYNRYTHRYNRTVNNMWCRGLIERGVKKFCGNNGIVLKEIPPEYSSMVGNLLFRAFDPVSAAAEIGRRSLSWLWINKFGKDSLPESLQWYPSLERLTQGDDMSYVPPGTRTVSALYKYLCASDKSVRRPLSGDQIVVHAEFNKGRVSHYSLCTDLFDFC